MTLTSYVPLEILWPNSVQYLARSQHYSWEIENVH